MSDQEQQNMQYPPHGYPWPQYPPGYGHPAYQGHPNQHQQVPPQAYYHAPPPPPGYGYPPQGFHPHQPHHAPQGHHVHQGHHAPQGHPESDALYQQAQGIVEGMMGDQVGVFKDMMQKMGIDDKEFWKGAMIGAAAALILGNENVRSSLLQMLTGAGDMLKTGGSKVKDSACKATSSVKEHAVAGNEIFKDTYSAGKQGFKDSVDRHRQTPEQAVSDDAVTNDEQGGTGA